MLDYDDLESLERYALAAGTEERQQLLAAGATAVTPGQAFLAGLFALEQGDLVAANERLASLGPGAHYQRLEALVALRSWPTDPAITRAYLERTCGLSFHAPAPAPDVAQPEGPSELHDGPDAGGAAAAAPRLSSSLDSSLYSDKAFLRKAVRQARGPLAPPMRPAHPQAAPEAGRDLAALLSPAGRVAALSYDEEFGLGLTLEERLKLVGAGSNGGRPKLAPHVQALAGSPLLTAMAKEAFQAQRGAVFESLLSYMTAEQLEGLVSELPLEVAVSPMILTAAVRNMYGTNGAVAGGAAAVDALTATTATSHRTPYLTSLEAAAIQRRVLEMCDRIQRTVAGAGAEGVSEQLTCLAARALLPLTKAAVRSAVGASIAAEGADPGDAVHAVVATKMTEAAGLLSRLVRALSALCLLHERGNSGLDLVFQQPTAGRQQALPLVAYELGPALPPLSMNMQSTILQLMKTLLHISPDPPALFAPGGALVGTLKPAGQARLLAEAMLTRGSQPAPGGPRVDWVAAYRDAGGDPAQLAESVELELFGTGSKNEDDWRVASGWGSLDDDVALLVVHKGVRHISVLVYDIATESFYRQTGREVDMGIDLEGLGATFRMDIALPVGLPTLQRCCRRVPLPQLKGRRGVWVVEVQGGGRHSRALIRRGSLAAVVRPSPAGLAMTVFSENGSRVEDPRVCVDGRVYGMSAKTGEVLVPYRADSAVDVPAVLVDGASGFASLMTLRHLTEEYSLQCGMHFEPESAAAGGRAGSAPLLLQLNLTIGGWTAPLELLQDVVLTVEVDDLEGGEGGGGSAIGARRQVFQDWSPGDGLRAAVVQVRLPDRPGRVTASLTGRIKLVAPGPDGEPALQSFSEQRTWELNNSDREPDALRNLYLTRAQNGKYLLRLLGRAGEPHPGVPVVVALTHVFSASEVPDPKLTDSAPPAPAGDALPEGDDDDGDSGDGAHALAVKRTLVTDADGTIDLGHLAGIAAVAAGVESSADAAPQSPSNAKARRRYRWRLPCGLSGAVPTGDRESHGAGTGDGDGLFRTDLLLRALASAGNDVQCRIPCTPLSRLTVEAAGEAADLRLRLGLVLVAVVPSALVGAGPREQDGQGSWKMAQLMDEKHVAVGEGCLEILGLGPGVYRLFATRLNLAATILVYKGPVVTPTALKASEAGEACDGGFVTFGGMVAPLSEAKPLQVTEFRASAAGGVTARLQGSPSQLSGATVHVILTRFEPHFGLGRLHSGSKALGYRLLSAGSGTAFGEPRTGDYQSGRQLGDEVRYVLERRRLVAEGRVRPTPALVERPSLLVQPCKVRETNTNIQVARMGEEFDGMDMAAAPRRAMMCAAAARGDNSYMDGKLRGAPYACCLATGTVATVEAKDVSSLGLDFCPPAVVLPNVPVGPDGVVQLSPEQLAAAVVAVAGPAGLRLSASDPWVAAGHRVARLIAYTAPAGVPSDAFGALSYCEARVAVEGVPPPSWSDPRLLTALQRPFPAGSGCVEQRSCHPLQPGSDLVVADAATAKLQLYATVSKIWALYGSLLSLAPHSPAVPYGDFSGAATWAELACVGSWSTLSSAAKVQRFSQLACRELAFFCYCHDPDFFRAVVLPYLRARLPSSRGCLDAWLAGVRGRQFVDVWTAPHLYATLTPLERILLAWEEDLLAGSEVALGASAPPPAAPAVLPRLARLEADMRARLRRQVVRVGSAAVADANRRRFEIALNGPGQGEEDRGPDADMCGAACSSFSDMLAEEVPESPPDARPMMMAMPSPRGAAALFGAAAPRPLGARQRGRFKVAAVDMEARRMQAAAPIYRAPQATQEWAEAGWFRRPPTERPDPNIISPESEFWADLAEHLSKGGRLGPLQIQPSAGAAVVSGSTAHAGAAFLPRHLETAGWTCSDALLATAVVGVPWEEAAPLSLAAGTRLTLTAVVPTVAYVRQTAALSGPGGAEAAAVAGGGGAAAAAGAAGLDTVQRSSSVLLLQRLLDPSLDPSELPKQRPGAEGGEVEEEEDEESKLQQNADGVEVPHGSPLLYGRQYCYAVTITNTGPAAVHLDVTIQAPEGAVPLGGRPALWVCTTEIQPYGARKLPLYYFYFPKPAPASGAAPGAEYGAFPAVAARRGRIVASALGQSNRLKVVPSLPAAPSLDLTTDSSGGWSWNRLAALPATPEADAARLRYLAEGDLSAANLGLVLWRCRDAGFWQQAVAALRRRRVWDEQIWWYAVLHRNEEAMKELVPYLAQLKYVLGPEAPAAGPLFGRGGTGAGGALDGADASVFDPDRPPHLEYWPLVNARAHPLGDKRVVLNDAVDASWRQLLRRLAALAAGGLEASTEDLLAAAYFLVLQDRPVEASNILGRVEARVRARPAAESAAPAGGSDDAATAAAAACNQDMQLSYLRAWLVLADPVASAADLQAAAASVRQWCQLGAAAAVTSERGAAAAGAAEATLPYKVLEPKWQARLAAMVAALDEVAAIAEGGGGGAAAAAAGGANVAVAGGTGGGGGGSVVKAEPALSLYDSPDGPRGAVVLEATGVQKVILNTRQMDLELLFSASPFDTTLASVSRAASAAPAGGGSASQGKFAFLRPCWTTTLDLQAIAAGSGACEGFAPGAIRLLPTSSSDSTGGGHYKLLIQPRRLVQALPAADAATGGEGAGGVAAGAGSSGDSGAMLLEAVSAEGAASSGGCADAAGQRRATLACYSCGFKAVVLRDKGVVLLTGAEDGVPVPSAYVKAYVKYDNDANAPGFHKDGYTDRRGLLDFWALTSKPIAKVRTVALFISHPVLGSTVLHTEPPLH